MLKSKRSLSIAMAMVALCATQTVDARSRHRAPKRTEPATVATPKITPSETTRDPEDVALDRRIKSICRGC
jgi:hypothetical protein